MSIERTVPVAFSWSREEDIVVNSEMVIVVFEKSPEDQNSA